MSDMDQNVFNLKKQTNPEIVPLLDRAYLYLEMGDYAKAEEMCEAALNKDSRNAQAYTYLLMAQLGVKKIEELGDLGSDYRQNNNYLMALRFADDEQKAFLEERAEASGKLGAVQAKDGKYNEAVSKMISATTAKDCDEVIRILESLGDWRDSVYLANNCRAKQSELREKESVAAKNKKRSVAIVTSVIAGVVLIAVVLTVVIVLMTNSDGGSGLPQNDAPEKIENTDSVDNPEKKEPEDTVELSPEEIKYNEALSFIENGKHAEAYQVFTELGDYKDSKAYLEKFVFEYDKVTEYFDKEVYITWEYVYDSNGNVLNESGNYKDDVSSYTKENTYDSDGNVLKVLKKYNNGNTYTTEYTYDADGKLLKTKEKQPFGNTNIIEYTYDGNGNLTKSVKNDDYVIEYTYDDNGRIIEEKNVEDNGFTSYTYDDNGNLTLKFIYYSDLGDGFESTTYTYDDNGRLIKEYTGYSDHYYSPDYSVDYTYDSKGKLIQKVSTQYDEYYSPYSVSAFDYTYEGEHIFYKG